MRDEVSLIRCSGWGEIIAARNSCGKAHLPGTCRALIEPELTTCRQILIQYARMRHIYRLLLFCGGSSLLLLTGCATGGHVVAGGGAYHVTAYKPNNPSA